MHGWLVAADDRTGALETAAELASADRPVVVSVFPRLPDGAVVDLGSRAVASHDAAARAASADAVAWSWTAHKIDSTLRGNWVAELRARTSVRPRPVVLVPAWPMMGRTCRGGVVHVDGRAVASVADAVARAVDGDGVVHDVTLLAGAHDLERWQPTAGAWAVVDVIATDDLHEVAAVVARRDWLVAGPAGALGAVHAARSGGSAALGAATARVPWSDGPVVVACASATTVSAEQLRRVMEALPDVEVIAAPPAGDSPLHPDAARMVAERVAQRLDRGDVATLVVVGGDTAAAVLGDGDRLVGGYAAPGMPWSTAFSQRGPLVITKAGGFGGPDALVDLLRSP